MKNRNYLKAAAVAVLIFALIVFGVIVTMIPSTASAITINEGYVGIQIHRGKAKDELLTAGKHWVWFDRVEIVDLHWQKYDVTTSAFSKDIQQVDVQMSFNYSLRRDGVLSVYRNIGLDYLDKIMLPLAMDALKSTLAKYGAEELITNREKIAEEVLDQIDDELLFYQIEVREVAITDIDFTDAFTNAVEAKQVASQNKLKMQTEQEQQTIVARAEAERATIAAEAEAERMRIQAESDAENIRIRAQAEADATKIAADAEAYRIQMEAENITDATIRKTIAERWNGELPTVTGEATTILDVSDIMSAEN